VNLHAGADGPILAGSRQSKKRLEIVANPEKQFPRSANAGNSLKTLKSLIALKAGTPTADSPTAKRIHSLRLAI